MIILAIYLLLVLIQVVYIITVYNDKGKTIFLEDIVSMFILSMLLLPFTSLVRQAIKDYSNK